MDAEGRMEVVRGLCSFEGRLAGTDAERRAAGFLAERLRGLGRRAELEPTYVHPQWALVQGLHCLIGLTGSLVAIAIPALGFALVLLAATSMYLDLNGRLYLARRLFFRRASQNVVSSPERGRAGPRAGRVILCAHYDAARTGAAFRPGYARLAARLDAALPFPISPFRILFWSLALLLPVLGARMAGVDANWLSLLQLLPTLVLVIGLFLLVDTELSEVVPGANDNASGVAAVLSVAERLGRDRPEHLDVWVLLTGGEECQQEGMRTFLRAHRDDLDPERTWFLCAEAVGAGRIRYESSTGPVVSFAMDPRLFELCEAIAAADAEGEARYDAAAIHSGVGSDALPPRLRRYPAIAIGCRAEDGTVPRRHRLDDLPEHLDAESMGLATDFLAELVRRLDRDVGRRLGPATSAVERREEARMEASLRRA